MEDLTIYLPLINGKGIRILTRFRRWEPKIQTRTMVSIVKLFARLTFDQLIHEFLIQYLAASFFDSASGSMGITSSNLDNVRFENFPISVLKGTVK